MDDKYRHFFIYKNPHFLHLFPSFVLPNPIVGFCVCGFSEPSVAKMTDTECNTLKANYMSMRSEYISTSDISCGSSYLGLYDGHFVALGAKICSCLENGYVSAQCKALDELCCIQGLTGTATGNNIYTFQTFAYNSTTGACTASSTKYGCAKGYYDTDGNFSTSGCTPCTQPDFYTDAARTNKWNATTSEAGMNAQAQCYASQGPKFYDTKGEFYLTGNCYY